MFDREATYPTAVSSSDDEGVDAAIAWSIGHMQNDDTLTVWTSLKSNLRNNDKLTRLVERHSDVEHVAGRGGGFIRNPGPVLMAWADMDDIGKLVQFSAYQIRSLCVITWNARWLRPWVATARPTILGDGSEWEQEMPLLSPVVVEALKSLTLSINHNNTILAGYEKDDVVGMLLALQKAQIPMNGEAMQAWALANGWSGDNPKHLAKYVNDINAGRRPRCRRVVSADHIALLQRRADGEECED